MTAILVFTMALGASTPADPGSARTNGAAPAYFFHVDSAPDDARRELVFVRSDEASPSEPKRVVIRSVSNGAGPNGEGGETIKWIGENPPQAGGPWLGVQFGPVPKPTRTQLGVEAGQGQMVLNVIEGSPADQAGIQQYDVILDVGGQKAPAAINEFLGVIRNYKPSQAALLTVLRGGQRVTTNLTFGARPDDLADAKYKYEHDAEELSQGHVFGRSGLLEKDPQGNWVYKGLNQKDLPDFWTSIPGLDENDFKFNIPLPGGMGGNQVFVQKSKGKTVKIEKAEDGKITVTTTTMENGQSDTQTKTYANEQEFEAADPDAHKSMKCEGPFEFRFFGDDAKARGLMPDDIRIHMEEALKQLPGMMAPGDDPGGPGAAMPRRFGLLSRRKATTSFETSPQGRIKVITRKGDDELVQEFENADALKSAKPDLYRKYERLENRTDSGTSRN